MTIILLVRHGQTEWNRIERFRGRYNVPLNDTGIEQAKAVAKKIARHWHPVAVYASPLDRAMKTAECIAQPLNLHVQPSQGLLDIDYGKWQGLTPDEARKDWPALVNSWYTNPQEVSIPGGENLTKVRERAMSEVYEICQRHTSETVVLVSHTVVNRLILLGILGLGNERFWRIKQEPCALNVMEFAGKDFTLVSLNDISHLSQ